ncbi:Transmembrane protein 129 [Nymphon striatum]|nr:Transmembrane protein 129 [Nymphon striatum]
MAILSALFFSIVYAIFSIFIIYPPVEVIAAGLTIEALFSKFLDSEELFFIQHHIARTTIVSVVYAFIPLVYCLGSEWFFDSSGILSNAFFSSGLCLSKFIAVIALVLPVIFLIRAFYWRKDNWKNHPISKNLSKYPTEAETWRSVALQINIEYLRVDKFSSGTSNVSRVIVTDSWVIKVMQMNLLIVLKSDAKFSLICSENHELSHIDSSGLQFLIIDVSSASKNFPSFSIRLNSLHYGDLREKLQQPISNPKNIIVHQTLSDKFIDVFKSQVDQNSKYKMPADSSELEPCIGCMRTTSNVKLIKKCSDEVQRSGSQKCTGCNCRPMWCLDCMARWFAARQDKSHPEQWLSSSSPCPTCRSVFCLLDVCFIE